VDVGEEDPRADLRWGSVPALALDAAERFADDEAVVDGETRLTFAEVASSATQVSRALMAAGVAPGDRVAIWAPNCAEWVTGALGALGVGGVLVPLNTRFKGPEAAYVLATSGARVLLTVRGFLGLDYPALLDGLDVGALERTVVMRGEAGAPGAGPTPVVGSEEFLGAGVAVPEVEAVARWRSVGSGDVSDLIFTSGTTGNPKGAMATHAQTLRTFGTWSSIVGLARGDRYLVVNPFFHTFGYKAGILACLMAGATLVPEAVFDAARVMERIEQERITVLPGPPTLYQSLLAHPGRSAADLSSLRLGVTGAAVVPVELVVAMRQELGFSTVLTAYGLTESCGTVTMCRRGDPPELVATTSGRAIPGLEVRVVDADGDAVAAGAEGEVVVRGYTVMPGYWGDPEATAQAVDPDGWLHTGDVGAMDEAGNVSITDRLKDMFTVGGFNTYPAEVEAVLRRCPGVGQVAVIGVPDERLGEVGCAVVVPDSAVGPDDEDLGRRVIDRARAALANYKVPRYVVLTAELPVNASGKVLKRELRRRFAERTDPVVATAATAGSATSTGGD